MAAKPGALRLGKHPRASACCRGIVTIATAITTIPSNASAATTIAIIAIDVVVFLSVGGSRL
jgi:hypothetical protein